MRLENDQVNVLWECVTMIEAQEQLKTFTALDWPQMKKSQRQKLHKDLFEKAYPRFMRKVNRISLEDLKRIHGAV